MSSMYIRTKDGVYEVKVNKYHELVYCKNNQIVLSCNIIKQSESLFELIDEFVVIRDSTKINQLVRTDNVEYLKEMMKEDKRIIAVKGAIWTDFGLRYVARLTEDGGIELICT